jgi:hypothetical protein
VVPSQQWPLRADSPLPSIVQQRSRTSAVLCCLPVSALNVSQCCAAYLDQVLTCLSVSTCLTAVLLTCISS